MAATQAVPEPSFAVEEEAAEAAEGVGVEAGVAGVAAAGEPAPARRAASRPQSR